MKCCQKKCNDDATYWVFWPGEGKKGMCSFHTLKAQNVCQAMGVHIHVEEMSEVPKKG
jgi:hypothetical protein